MSGRNETRTVCDIAIRCHSLDVRQTASADRDIRVTVRVASTEQTLTPS
jgi:hypothetical protein